MNKTHTPLVIGQIVWIKSLPNGVVIKNWTPRWGTVVKPISYGGLIDSGSGTSRASGAARGREQWWYNFEELEIDPFLNAIREAQQDDNNQKK